MPKVKKIKRKDISQLRAKIIDQRIVMKISKDLEAFSIGKLKSEFQNEFTPKEIKDSIARIIASRPDVFEEIEEEE